MKPFIVCLNNKWIWPGKVYMGCSCRMKKKITSTWTRNVSRKPRMDPGQWERACPCRSGPNISATRKALGLEPRLDIAKHFPGQKNHSLKKLVPVLEAPNWNSARHPNQNPNSYIKIITITNCKSRYYWTLRGQKNRNTHTHCNIIHYNTRNQSLKDY